MNGHKKAGLLLIIEFEVPIYGIENSPNNLYYTQAFTVHYSVMSKNFLGFQTQNNLRKMLVNISTIP